MTTKEFLLNGFKMLKTNLVKDNLTGFKIKAYNSAIKAIESHDSDTITDLSDVKGLTKKMQEKAADMMTNTGMQEDIKNNAEKQKAIEIFSNVMAIGDVKAKELVNTHDIMSIEQLNANQHLLNDKQKLGLKHYDDFLERIPRKEMDRHNLFLETAMHALQNITFCVVGSYRRGLASSGDIDVLITSQSDDVDLKTIVTLLEKEKYLSDAFAFGKEKYLGTAKIPRFKRFRRIDLLYINKAKYPFALLYFTGSQQFNIKMRQIALDKGLSLSEHGFKYLEGDLKGEFVKDVFKTEMDIFKYIGMEYVEPKDR